MFPAVSEEWAQEIERKAGCVDVSDKERLVVFLVCKYVLMTRHTQKKKGQHGSLVQVSMDKGT